MKLCACTHTHVLVYSEDTYACVHMFACACQCRHVLCTGDCVLRGCFLRWEGVSLMSLRTEIQNLSLIENVPQDEPGDRLS